MSQQLAIELGPFKVLVISDINRLLLDAKLLYRGRQIPESGFFDFRVSIERSVGARRWWRPQVNFLFDGYAPFKPLPVSQALPLLEWGLNWCITTHCHDYLIVHAAVVEKNGAAFLMPAPSGSGKSTLCAALVCSGWRLLSDELALIRLDGTGKVVPLARPICLKNRAVNLISDHFPGSEFGPVCTDTAKGDVAHMLPPTESVRQVEKLDSIKFIVCPRYNYKSRASLSMRSKSKTFFEVANQSFNFHILGETGFNALKGVVDQSQCLEFVYSTIDEALQVFENLASGVGYAGLRVSGDAHTERC